MSWILLAALSSAETYSQAVERLERERVALAAQPRSDGVRRAARAHLTERIRADLITPWVGTRWAFYGTTETPGQGEIACGYFVSTVLRDAGLKVERVKLAQQASEYIVRTFSEPSHIRRFRAGDEAAVVEAVLEQPDGLYVVGLDYHVGLLVRRGAEIEFCHSTFVDSVGVVCEDPRTAPAFVSNYHVVGPVLEDAVVDAWLDQTRLVTVTK